MRRRVRAALCLGVLACFAEALYAQPAAAPDTSIRAKAARPLLRWGEVIGVAATTGVAALADRWVRDEVYNPTSAFSNTLADVGNGFGDGKYVYSSLIVLSAVGKLSGHEGIYGVASRALKSTVLSGAVAIVLKSSIGRERPLVSPDDQFDFHPFRFKDNSFPSGHTAVAFALATSLARETPDQWSDVGFFTVASLTGWARIQNNKHWSSDLVLGAGLGILSARFVHRVQRRLSLTPTPAGIAGSISF